MPTKTASPTVRPCVKQPSTNPHSNPLTTLLNSSRSPTLVVAI